MPVLCTRTRVFPRIPERQHSRRRDLVAAGTRCGGRGQGVARRCSATATRTSPATFPASPPLLRYALSFLFLFLSVLVFLSSFFPSSVLMHGGCMGLQLVAEGSSDIAVASRVAPGQIRIAPYRASTDEKLLWWYWFRHASPQTRIVPYRAQYQREAGAVPVQMRAASYRGKY